MIFLRFLHAVVHISSLFLCVGMLQIVLFSCWQTFVLFPGCWGFIFCSYACLFTFLNAGALRRFQKELMFIVTALAFLSLCQKQNLETRAWIWGNNTRETERGTGTVTWKEEINTRCVTGPATELGNWAKSPWLKPHGLPQQCIPHLRGEEKSLHPPGFVTCWPNVALLGLTY